MKPNNMVKENYNYYLEHKKELCEKYLNKFIIIKEQSFYGAYETMEEAIENAKKIEAGTYIIQKCEKEEDIQIFHTRVRFNA